MIIQTTHLNNGMTTHTFVKIGTVVYCHSDNGREQAIFPAKFVGEKYSISSWSEIEDYRIAKKVYKIVESET